MAQQQIINTVIVLRNDQTTNWESSDHVMLPGEVGIGYLDNGNVIAKLGDGEHTWTELPQIEGVFEDDVTLTYNFGKHVTSNGSVVTPAKGMTTSQWLIDALSEIKEPTVTQPTFTMTADATGAGGEIGTYLTKLNWNGTTTYGEYEYGPATGLSAANRTWAISNNIDNQTGTAEDGSFTLTTPGIQLTQEETKTYATITANYTLNAANAAIPVNNVGGEVPSKKITDKTGTITAEVEATAYRKPFYGVLTPAEVIDTDNLTSAAIRALPSSGSQTKGFPTSINVPVGSQMVIFAAKAGTYKTLVAKDSNAMNAVVSFEKVANAVNVEGANGVAGVAYDIWYVNWGAGIGSAKNLALTWN